MQILLSVLTACLAVYGFYSFLYTLIGRTVGKGNAEIAVRLKDGESQEALTARITAVRLLGEERFGHRCRPVVLAETTLSPAVLKKLRADDYQIFLRYPEAEGEPDGERDA